jgi:hypothetical protein
MRKMIVALAAAAVTVMLGAPASAATMTVKGELIDEGCSVKPGASGKLEKVAGMDACALDCAKKGEPVALFTADGKVYRVGGALAANKNAKLVAHMGHTVEITGDVSEKDGKMTIAADAIKMVK